MPGNVAETWYFQFDRNGYSFGFVNTVIAPGAAVDFNHMGMVVIAMHARSWQASAGEARGPLCMLGSQRKHTARRASLPGRAVFSYTSIFIELCDIRSKRVGCQPYNLLLSHSLLRHSSEAVFLS